VSIENRFVHDAPSQQAVVDLFQGEWSSKMPPESGLLSLPGHAELFDDPRVTWACKELGPFEGMDIIELGPLEGAHSYMMDRLGARSVVAIEANTRAYLKCLCIKEVFGLKNVRFELGDFSKALYTVEHADLIFASGVLYHMTEPLDLLEQMCSKTNRLFLWTHYFDDAIIASRDDHELFAPVQEAGNGYRLSKRLYPEAALNWTGFSGGVDTYAAWIERESLLRFITDHGFSVRVEFDHKDHPNGPALALCASR
jgi:Protein of unknown function (DUF1698)